MAAKIEKLQTVPSAQPAKMHPKAHFVEYTPDAAAEALETRPERQHVFVNRANVERFARDMLAGDFHPENGETIKFNEFGELIDGQNRLQAIVETGISQRMLTVYGVPDLLWRTIDAGRTRQPSLMLRARNVSDAPHFASVIRLLWLHDNGLSLNTSPRIKPTESERAKTEEQHPEVFTIQRMRLPGIPGASVTFMNYLLVQKHGDKAQEFFEQLRSGLAVSPNDPVLVLRRRFSKLAHKRPSPGEIAHLIMHAWEAYREGRDVATLMVRKPDEPIRV